jgi:hypothetical protein
MSEISIASSVASIVTTELRTHDSGQTIETLSHVGCSCAQVDVGPRWNGNHESPPAEAVAAATWTT